MTCREKLKMEHPNKVGEEYLGGCEDCPPAAVKKPTETPTYPIKKATDDYIDPIYITIHTNCIDDPAEVIAEVFKYACTVKDRMVNISIQ